MNVFQQLEAANAAHATARSRVDLPVRPARRLAVITCMDARIDVYALLGLALGDVHVIRTAGGRVTDDVQRSLALSTHLLGTRNVAVVTHTDCGLHDPDGALVGRLESTMGHPPEAREWHTFADPATAVLEDCGRLLCWPDRPAGLAVAGYVLDIATGRLRKVHEGAAPPPD